MSKETLLVVEDNLVMREGLGDILTYEGYQVVTAANGLEALEQMRKMSPDLILSDIAMPEMDGISFFQAVRSNPHWVTIPFVFLTARGEKEDIRVGRNLGAEDYLVKPLSQDELVAAVRARLERSRELHLAQLHQAYESSLTLLANAVEIRDRYTRGHVERVTDYSQALAVQMGWRERNLEQLRFGSILHDIGKILIRESTLFKPNSLNEEEWLEIKHHPITGSEMLKSIPFLAPAVPIVRHHHERWDGRGYPDGLAGESIPAAARIIAVADSYDAMTTDRPYCAARSLGEAYREILACSGTQYDPAVVSAFTGAWEAGVIQAVVAKWQLDRS